MTGSLQHNAIYKLGKKLWTSSPQSIVAAAMRKIGYEIKKPQGNVKTESPYRQQIIDLVHTYLSERYSQTCLPHAEFNALIRKYQAPGVIRSADTFNADLWELFRPDYKSDMDRYYLWHELNLMMGFMAYSVNAHVIDSIYAEPYRYAFERLEECHVFEFGGGLCHGLLSHLLNGGKPPKSFTLVEIDALHTDFVEWFLRRQNVEYEIFRRPAGVRPVYKPRFPVNFVYVKGVLEHIDNPRGVVTDILEWVAPDGLLALDLSHKGAVVYQHISPNLPVIKEELTNRGYVALQEFSKVVMWGKSEYQPQNPT